MGVYLKEYRMRASSLGSICVSKYPNMEASNYCQALFSRPTREWGGGGLLEGTVGIVCVCVCVCGRGGGGS